MLTANVRQCGGRGRSIKWLMTVLLAPSVHGRQAFVDLSDAVSLAGN